MPRVSGFRGTWSPNKRPYITITPDVWVAFQQETSVIWCGECKREVNFNDYITGISTEASVDSPPGSATINLSIPDTDVNDFFVDGQLIIIPMMEVEIYAKGYFLVGGFPQYYRIFWGLVSSVSKSWSGGTTSVTINCKDILRWWELTNVTINPAFIDPFGSSAGGYQLWGNQFAGQNPYTVIIALAKESMGDFSLTTGSFTSYLPERGPERQIIASYAKDIMAYWQLKFSNIWNSLVLYGTSGQMYTLTGIGGTSLSPSAIASSIFKSEAEALSLNQATNAFKIQPHEIATFKKELSKAGDVEFFQTDNQTKLTVALQSRDQAGYEFYCDTTGDIIFKPPFYNLNVMPNKPISWVQDFEVIDDSVTDSEQEVYTHITSSGNAFGGTTDWGLNDEITTPRTGAFDFHLLRRYGWRRLDYQCEWAGNPLKLFYHLLDYLDRVNAKRQNGTVTIPMRPELRMGFPIWFPKYDSFFYVQGISHNFSVGGQATTTLTLIAKRSKFVAPNNIGQLKESDIRGVVTKDSTGKSATRPDISYEISFPDRAGASASLGDDSLGYGNPAVIRDPKTGKLLGFPNAVMVYRSTHKGQKLVDIVLSKGMNKGNKGNKNSAGKPDVDFNYNKVNGEIIDLLQSEARDTVLKRLRAHRYEAAMTNAGAYDYAFDTSRVIKELSVLPIDKVSWGTGTDGNKKTITNSPEFEAKSEAQVKAEKIQKIAVDEAKTNLKSAQDDYNKKQKIADDYMAKKYGKNPPKGGPTEEDNITLSDSFSANSKLTFAKAQLADEEKIFSALKSSANPEVLPDLDMLVRPVSDEFGFEVIGHYRYGRGAFIDRGQLKVINPDTSAISNQLNIQFASTSGLLTDTSKPGDGLSPSAISFSEAFEKMQPDDYITGASFTGSRLGVDPLNFNANINVTSQQTYTNLVNANKGTGVYVEADATRRAITLGELKPTISFDGLSNASTDCACQLGKTNWLTILPLSVVKTVLGEGSFSSTTTEKSSKEKALQIIAEADAMKALFDDGFTNKKKATITDKVLLEIQIKYVSESNKKEKELIDKVKNKKLTQVQADKELSDFERTKGLEMKQEIDNFVNSRLAAFEPGDSNLYGKLEVSVNNNKFTLAGFFSSLSEYLSSQFTRNYEQNKLREDIYTATGRNLVDQIPDIPSNVAPEPDNALAMRASLGDPDALAALQNNANFDFGLSKDAMKKFNAKFKDQPVDNTTSLADINANYGKTNSASSIGPAQQFQPLTGPSFSSIINPTEFAKAKPDTFKDRSKGP